MKTLNETALSLIGMLNDGHWHNGQQMATTLGISRNAIWKQLNALRTLGLVIEGDKQNGYRMTTPFIPFNESSLDKRLDKIAIKQAVIWHIYAEISSTNAFLKSQFPREAMWDICLAESQLKGRGRFQRDWHSPFGKNVYCSINWVYRGDVSELSGLSLVIGIALLKALVHYGVDKDALSIKWPNDIFYHDKKIAGILIELSAESHHQTQVVIGIGLNVNMEEASIGRGWTSLRLETSLYHDRNEVVAQILNSVLPTLSNYHPKTRESYLSEWQSYDYLYQQSVKINMHGKVVEGIAQGIDNKGDLMVSDNQGVVTHCASGEASLKKGI